MKKGALPNAARGPAAIRAIVAPFRQKFKQRAGRCSSLRLYAFNAAEDIGITNLGLEPSLPGVALPLIGVTVFGLAASKFAAYSQLEFVRTAMLTRHVANAARVVMLGGSTKDVFYFPEGTINVTAVDPDLSISLFEQAGMTAGVPVSAVKATALAHLRSLPAASVESVVAINKLKGGREAEEVVIEGYRVLKPGGTFVFINQVDGGAFASLLRLGGRNSSADAGVGDKVSKLAEWDFVQWDVAAGALDPHIVGVAVKPLQQKSLSSGSEFSVEKETFQQLMKSNKGKGGKGGSGFRK